MRKLLVLVALLVVAATLPPMPTAVPASTRISWAPLQFTPAVAFYTVYYSQSSLLTNKFYVTGTNTTVPISKGYVAVSATTGQGVEGRWAFLALTNSSLPQVVVWLEGTSLDATNDWHEVPGTRTTNVYDPPMLYRAGVRKQ